MNVDHLIARIVPAAALAIAVGGTFLVFAAYFQ